MNGNTNVMGFFIIGAAIFTLLAARFLSAKAAPYKNFGLGLGSFALAFLVWAVIVGVQPTDSLELYMSFGVIPFVAGFLFLVSSATYDWIAKNRNLAMAFAVAFLIALFVVRTFILPSAPAFSENGLIYFNAHPLVELMYVLAFAGGFMTSLQVVSREIKHRLTAALTRIFFNLVVVCGVILLSSNDDLLQAYNGVLMLAALIGLAVVYAPSKVKGYLK